MTDVGLWHESQVITENVFTTKLLISKITILTRNQQGLGNYHAFASASYRATDRHREMRLTVFLTVHL